MARADGQTGGEWAGQVRNQWATLILYRNIVGYIIRYIIYRYMIRYTLHDRIAGL